jgi:hypothetical protein
VLPPHWPQPRRPLRVGAAGIEEFSALVQADPHFASAWGEVSTQLQAEGTADLTGAKIALSNSFDQLASQSFGLSPQDAADAAKKFVLAGQTIMGAVETVQSLVRAAEDASPAEVLAVAQTFVGTMIGVATAAGAVSAGIGAAIVAVITIAISLLESSGLLAGFTPTGVTYKNCYNLHFDPTPDWLAGCVGFKGQKTSPGAPNWRQFPNPIKDPTDNLWYIPPNGDYSTMSQAASLGSWRGLQIWAGLFNGLPINEAFPAYIQLEYWGLPVGAYVGSPDGKFRVVGAGSRCTRVLSSPISNALSNDFVSGYITAWKANAEFALNGLKAQDDWMVLQHFIRVWNRAHSSATTVTVQPVQDTSGLPLYGMPYWQNLVYQMASGGKDPKLQDASGNLLINTGPTLAPKKTVSLHLGIGPSTGLSTPVKVAVGAAVVGGAAVASTAVYAFATKTAFSAVWKNLWKFAIRG